MLISPGGIAFVETDEITMVIPRLQLFEFDDLGILRGGLRRVYFEALGVLHEAFSPYEVLRPRFEFWLAGAENWRVLDIGSGAGAHLIPFATALEGAAQRGVTFLLSDLHPCAPVFDSTWKRLNNPAVRWLQEPLDARNMKSGYQDRFDAFTLFTVAHHFPPHILKDLLNTYLKKGAAIFVAEPCRRDFRHLVAALLVSFLAAFGPAWRARGAWQCGTRLLLAPLLWIAIAWDGVVSVLRSYSAEEIRALMQGVPESASLEFGRKRYARLLEATYFMVLPKRIMAADASL